MERLSAVARHLERAHPPGPAPLPASTGESPKHILIVGATGLLGRAVVDHFCALDGWTVTSIARRQLQGAPP